jgi:hypothetical protein
VEKRILSVAALFFLVICLSLPVFSVFLLSVLRSHVLTSVCIAPLCRTSTQTRSKLLWYHGDVLIPAGAELSCEFVARVL